MGGDEPAHTLIAAALSMGKRVVTANKHVIAHHGPELEAIARRTGAALRFEAAVGGGIPILGPLAADLAANRVEPRPRHRQRHDQLHPHGDDRPDAPARLRRRAGRGAAAGLRRGRPVRRRRGPRRRQQAGHPRPARLRPLARPGRDRDPPGRAGRAGRRRASPASRLADQRDARAPRAGSSGSWPPRRATATAAARPRSCPTALPIDSAARPDGRRAQPDRGRRRAGRPRRLRRPGRRRCRDLVGRARRPPRDRPRRRVDLGCAASGRRRDWRRRRPPGRRRRSTPASGVRYPIDD